MKLLSTEIGENSVELTYADNPELDAASRLLIVRQPFDGDPYKSVAWNQLRVMSALAQWADEERRRIRDEIEKNI